jgi:hypothetical protein
MNSYHQMAILYMVTYLCPMVIAEADSQQEWVVVQPQEYKHALRNPLKGFTNRGFYEDNEWATLVHCYIPWNQIENHESDGIDKIKEWCGAKWAYLAERNQKVIPRVYLHWSGDRKYWPADMEEDDYTSQQFTERVIRPKTNTISIN